MSAPNPPVPTVTQPIAPEVVAQLLANQARQFDIREKEIEVERMAAETERKKVDNAHEYSLRALAVQKDDRFDSRAQDAKTTRFGFWITLILVVGIFGLTGYAMYTNKDQLILEVVKAVLFAGGGGGVGFVIGFRKGEGRAAPNQSPPA